MTRLLDYIFSNIEERNLDIKKIQAYIRYLDEIILNGLPIENELEYQGIKLKLIKRMNALTKEHVKVCLPDKKDNENKDNP